MQQVKLDPQREDSKVLDAIPDPLLTLRTVQNEHAAAIKDFPKCYISAGDLQKS